MARAEATATSVDLRMSRASAGLATCPSLIIVYCMCVRLRGGSCSYRCRTGNGVSQWDVSLEWMQPTDSWALPTFTARVRESSLKRNYGYCVCQSIVRDSLRFIRTAAVSGAFGEAKLPARMPLHIVVASPCMSGIFGLLNNTVIIPRQR